jgi:hypothetical protein
MVADQALKFDSLKSVVTWNSQVITPYVTDVDFPFEYNVNDGTVFGSTGYRPWPSIFKCTFTIKGFYNMVTTTGIAATLQAACTGQTAQTFFYYPMGTTAGNVSITGSAYVNKFRSTSQVGKIVTFEAECQLDNGSSSVFTTA